MATNLSKLFKGKDTQSEELKEAKAIKSGKISPAQYAKGEKMEEAKNPKVHAKFSSGGPIKNVSAVGGGLTAHSTEAGKYDTKVSMKPSNFGSTPAKSFVKRADGIASKGKTQAKQVAMKKGGRC